MIVDTFLCSFDDAVAKVVKHICYVCLRTYPVAENLLLLVLTLEDYGPNNNA